MDGQEVHLSNRSVFKLVFGFVFILVLAGALYLIYDQYLTSSALLDVKVEPKENQILPNEKLAYHVELTNIGSGKKFDATLTYRVLTPEGRILATKQETLAVSTSLSLDREITLPSRIQPGKYQLKTLVTYDKKTASALFTFDLVTEKTTPTKPEEKPVEKSIEQPPETPEPRLDPEFQDFLLRIEETAATNPAAAQNACQQQKDPLQHDDCLRVVVKTSRRAEFCDSITDDNTRDNCYLSFIVEGNSALCGKIVLETNKDYCNRLRDIDILAQYYTTHPPA